MKLAEAQAEYKQLEGKTDPESIRTGVTRSLSLR